MRKVLKPNEFQEFELKEKTILTHNTAMYDLLAIAAALLSL